MGVEVVQNMYKVNVDEINQLLAYHEVFGKLQSDPGQITPKLIEAEEQQGTSTNSAVRFIVKLFFCFVKRSIF